MAGIHVLSTQGASKDVVDGRNKSGHDADVYALLIYYAGNPW
jgi:hypothetical protein